VSELAIDAMRGIGVDISAHRSKSVSEFEGQHFDIVIASGSGMGQAES